MSNPLGRPKGSHKAIEVAATERRYRMLELTKAGHTQRDIAQIEGVARSLVSTEVKRALVDMAKDMHQTAETVRDLQTERLNKLLSVNWPDALERDPNATATCLSVIRQIALLHGLYPDKSTIIQNTAQFLNPADFKFSIAAASGNREAIEGEAKTLD
jgi:hypothetical protein